MVKRVVVGSFSTNCYLLSLEGNKCIIIDPGDDGEKIERAVKDLDLKPVMILCTHGHLDHIGAADYLIDVFSTDEGLLPLAAAKKEKPFFGPDAKNLHKESFMRLGLNEFVFESMYTTIPKLDIELEPGDVIEGTDFKVLETPGHTEGSISFVSKKTKTLFSGDCVMANGVGRTDLPGGNWEKQEDSIYNVIFKQQNDFQLFPGHGPSSTIERIKNNNNLF